MLEVHALTHLPFKILPELNILIVKVKQTLLFEELVWHPNEFMLHEDFKSGVNILYDLTEIDELKGDLEFLLSSIDRLKDESFIPVPAKTAFCVSPECQSVMKTLKGICIMTRGCRVEHNVFDDVDEALNHLNINQQQLSSAKSALVGL